MLWKLNKTKQSSMYMMDRRIKPATKCSYPDQSSLVAMLLNVQVQSVKLHEEYKPIFWQTKAALHMNYK